MPDGGGLAVGAGGAAEGAVLPLQVEGLLRLGLAHSPHSEDGVAVPLRIIGDGQAGLPAGEDDGLALHTSFRTSLAWLTLVLPGTLISCLIASLQLG